jgi:hypothetical protein
MRDLAEMGVAAFSKKKTGREREDRDKQRGAKMRIKRIGFAIVLSFILLGTQNALSGPDKQPGYIDIYGGFDGLNLWYLTDINLDSLEVGDQVMSIWVGPNGAIDPPVQASGSPLNGQVTGDDVVIPAPSAFINGMGLFFFTIPNWNPGDTDSLGRQRHPTPGEEIYVRVFDADQLVDATYYGDSNLNMVAGGMGEVIFVQFPKDPVGPTTENKIYGRFFKVIGGIDPTTGQTVKIKDPVADLEDGDVVQLISVGPDDEIDIPDALNRIPSDDDELIGTWGINEGMFPSTGTSVFKKFTASYDTSTHGRPFEGEKIYVRVFNAANVLEATYYGDSPIYTVNYTVGESLHVFYDDAVDCDTEFPASDVRDFSVYGGWDPVLQASWPLVDVYGLRLKDGDKVQLIWAGPDTLIDEMEESTGMPSGDDSVLVSFGIGEGILGTGTGRFIYDFFTYQTHKKGNFPAQGDIIYLRVFDDSTIGDDAQSKWYGQSETYTVQWEFNEEWYAFPDSNFDATVRAPWYRSLKIYAGTDTAQAEYPLTDSSGTQLEDGDLVQIIWAGPDGTIDPLGTSDCMPTGDDSLWATMAIGEGYDANSGLFKTELQTFKTLHLAEGDVLYLRIFNGDVYTDATHYAESATHTIAYQQGETFHVFDDAALDCVIPNPCFTNVEEWANPSASLPTTYVLYQNFPNPFNPETDIRYQIPESGNVQLVIYNVLGQKICTLVDGQREAGSYTVRWFGTDQSGRSLGSGIYFYRLQAGDFSETRKMVLMK